MRLKQLLAQIQAKLKMPKQLKTLASQQTKTMTVALNMMMLSLMRTTMILFAMLFVTRQTLKRIAMMTPILMRVRLICQTLVAAPVLLHNLKTIVIRANRLKNQVV